MEAGFEKGKITLDHENGVYYSGQVFKGNVTFILKQVVNITAINIQFLGEAKVQWWEEEKEVRSGQTFRNKVEYKGQEQYFNYVQCLTGGQGPQQLKPGTHNYPFQFQIPPTVPSSFKGEKGEVKYEIRAYMEFADQKKNRKELARLFEVVAPLDLNKADPEIAQPIQLSFEEVYNCGCVCGARPVTVEVSLPARGYCPGQAVPVSVDVRNDASIEVKGVSMQIVAKNRFRSQHPVAEYCTAANKLASHKTGAVLSNTQRHIVCELPLPDMVAPNLDNCGIMDVEYLFKVKIRLSGCNDDLQDDEQIYIGLVPLTAITTGEYVHPLADRLPPGPVPDIPAFVPQMNQNMPQMNQNMPQMNQMPQVNQHIAPQFNQPAMPPSYPGYNPTVPPYPGVAAPYPAAAPPYPTAPYPGANSAYPAPNLDIGFKIPPANPGYPM